MDYGCREKKLFSASNPNSGIKVDLCIVILVRIECIGDAGVDFLIGTLLFAFVHVHAIVGCKRPRKSIFHFGETGSMIDIQLASYKWLRRGVSFSSLVDMQ
jgi:hypothetical protein